MSWQPTDTMSLKTGFMHFAQQRGANLSALCAGYGISRKTGYKWLRRYQEAGADGLAERPRRPLSSPALTDAETAGRITALRQEHPAWGARKRRAVLAREGVPVPSASTVHAVLRRGGLITAEASGKARAWQRFERAAPNELWQMDFKGHFGIGTRGARCHPLTVLDDHSRYNLVLQACAGETCATVQEHLGASASAATVCRWKCSATTARRGAVRPGGNTGARSPCGCCAAGCACGTGGRTIRKPRARKNAFTGR